MKITADWLDEQIKAATKDGDAHMQVVFQCQGVIRMAECLKARLAAPEPEEVEKAESDASNIVSLNGDQNP